MDNSYILQEITPLKESDCFYLAERIKDSFDYPLHKHEVLELNFIENGEGAKRIVGDCIEILGKYDLVLIGAELEHGWEQNECKMQNVHEIMIQFPTDLLSKALLQKTQCAPLKKLIENSKKGISFDAHVCEAMRPKIMEIMDTEAGFYRLLKLYELLYELSLQDECHTLASGSFTYSIDEVDSRRVKKIEDYINKNYKNEIRLTTLGELVGMTPTSFSRFFKLRTGRSLSDYIIDIRLGHAARKLADTITPIIEICYDCGFNNISNFNRIFKNRKGCTPSAFRADYRDNANSCFVRQQAIKKKDTTHKKKVII
ncbi:MAG: AraC family transcriptional regulator [Bacteroidaceae bacterium]|nr:AraC family transcriptional regulator [Bacteroidaceae bacterium]